MHALLIFQRNTQEREGGRESPRLAPETASPVEAASASVSPTPELSEEVMKKKALSIIDEYLDIRDMKVGEIAAFSGEFDSLWAVRYIEVFFPRMVILENSLFYSLESLKYLCFSLARRQLSVSKSFSPLQHIMSL